MPREFCVGNGNLLVNLDANLSIRDLYFPYVGMENHVGGHFCRFGIWVDGVFSWIDDSWEKEFRYKDESLVTDVLAKKPDLHMEIRIEDVVHNFQDLFLRRVLIKNKSEEEREFRLYFSHDLHLSDTDKGITAYYAPNIDSVVHFKKDRYVSATGLGAGRGLLDYAVGVTEFGGLKGTWKDAEDGDLSGNPVAHGSVDSTISLGTKIPGGQEDAVYYWIAVGKDLAEILKLHKYVAKTGPQKLLHGAETYYRNWVNKSEIDFGELPSSIVQMFKRSLLILRTQIDDRGGIIASSDSDILRFNKDTYNYVWPRDGAFVCMGLDAAGYYHVTQRFFEFCKKIITQDGFLYQKYHPDGSWGSTWHPWIGPNGERQLPIQEDETALVLFSLWKHYKQARDIEFIADLYEPLICKAADFLVEYRDSETSLPLPSYDLWEEKRGISTFTTSAVYAGLQAASKFAEIFGHERAKKYHRAAMEVKDALIQNLYDEETERFLKMIKPSDNGDYLRDQTIDSSVYGIFEFGVLPAEDSRVEKTMKSVESLLTVRTDVGGLARYTNDYYQQVAKDIEKVPGNPWPICTLWLAEWYIAKKELGKGKRLLQWVVDHASQSGVLPEQVHPYNHRPLSVSPLTWSHSTFVVTVIEYLNMLNETNVCEKCGLPIYQKRKGKLW